MSLQRQKPGSVSATLDARRLFRFWLPLVLTSQLVTLSGPLLNVALGRASDPTRELAAFWIAFTVVLFAESGCLVVQQAALALGADRGPFWRLALGAVATGALSSGAVLAMAWPPLASVVFGTLVPTTPRVAALATSVLVVLAPLPLLVALRGLVAAVALRRRRTRLVAAATALRLVVIALVVAFAAAGRGEGAATTAAAAWIAGTLAETALLALRLAPRLRARLRRPHAVRVAFGAAGLARLVVPLVVATLAWTATRPVVNAVLGRLADPEAAQAGFGVALPILMVTCSPLWALLDVSLVMPRHGGDLARVIRFGAGLVAAFTAGLALLAFTPLGVTLLRLGYDLAPRLERPVAAALPLLVIEPLALAARAIAQGVLLRARRTGAFLVFAPLRLGAMLAAGFAIAAAFPHAGGAALGVGLVVGADVLDAALFAARACRLVASGEAWPSVAPVAGTVPIDAIGGDPAGAPEPQLRRAA